MKKIKFSNGVKFKMSPKNFVQLIASYVDYEDVLFKDVEGCRERGYLTKLEFLKLCYVKSPRRFGECKKNTPGKIKNWTKKAFTIKMTDEERVKKLIRPNLNGVRIPTASFILSAWNPIEYGTYDYRMRQVLEKYKIEDFERPDNKNMLRWYLAELKLLRKWRDEFKLKAARQVEYALWRYQSIGEVSSKEFTLE